MSRKPEGFCNFVRAGYTAPMKSRLYSCLTLLALTLGASGQGLPTTNLTAFALVKEGDKFIAPQAKDKITGMHSEKSDARLIPDVWYVYYYDSTTSFKTTEVKFVAGNVVQVKQPKHLLGSSPAATSIIGVEETENRCRPRPGHCLEGPFVEKDRFASDTILAGTDGGGFNLESPLLDGPDGSPRRDERSRRSLYLQQKWRGPQKRSAFLVTTPPGPLCSLDVPSAPR